jgi:hypothetical protein
VPIEEEEWIVENATCLDLPPKFICCSTGSVGTLYYVRHGLVSEILIFTHTTFREVVLLQPLGNCYYTDFVIFFLSLVTKVGTLTHTLCYYCS